MRIYNLKGNWLKTLRNNFQNNVENEITQGYGANLSNTRCYINLRNQSNKATVKIFW